MATPPPSADATPSSSTLSLNSIGQDTVQARQVSIRSKYTRLQTLAKERKLRLEEAKKKLHLTRETNELDHWINDKEALASWEEAGKDLEHVETLLKKVEDFEKDIAGNEPRLDNINKIGEDLIDEGHTDADQIQRLCEVGCNITCMETTYSYTCT